MHINWQMSPVQNASDHRILSNWIIDVCSEHSVNNSILYFLYRHLWLIYPNIFPHRLYFVFVFVCQNLYMCLILFTHYDVNETITRIDLNLNLNTKLFDTSWYEHELRSVYTTRPNNQFLWIIISIFAECTIRNSLASAENKI